MTAIKPLIVDLSHHDPADDYEAVKNDGIVGVIYKATQGTGYTDPTYVQQQHAAKAAGLLFGSYHFADGSDVHKQVNNYMKFACPDPDELFCLDWEDNPGGSYGKMSLDNVKVWIDEVENALQRPGECVLYGGNTIKEALGDNIDPFLGARRLWLCQYGTNPVVPASWDHYFLWQFTDSVYGPEPHEIEGIGPCDINSYDGDAQTLIDEWASGHARPTPPPVPGDAINVMVLAPEGVRVIVREVGPVARATRRRRFR